jgi:hypothetical protein
LRIKNKQIDEDQKKIESFSQKAVEMRMLLNEMTKKYCDVAKVNTENSKKMKVIQEGLELKIKEKEFDVEKECHIRVEAMKSAVKTKEDEIERLKNEIIQLDQVGPQGKSIQKEIADLKSLLKRKEDETTSARHEIHLRYVHDLKKKDLMLIDSHHRIDFLSQKASEWYQAFRDCQQEMHAMRKQYGVRR